MREYAYSHTVMLFVMQGRLPTFHCQEWLVCVCCALNLIPTLK